MAKYRSILAILLAFVTTLLVSCSSPAKAKPPTYTSAQLEQIQIYQSDINAMQQRLPELATLIQKREWTNVRNFIHGPLGELRSQTSRLIRNLLPNAQPEAEKLAKNIFGRLIKIDFAAESTNYDLAIRSYGELRRDLDAFFQLLPQA
ncbi:MAG: photosystem II protein PsbQ [Scytolyngbya sp. HA4215-MV1]|jgi:photosystem II protein PsbQ|nr:photosystem II protein PsbQ [Scytolyngbya sp. HA4215-MV1]